MNFQSERHLPFLLGLALSFAAVICPLVSLKGALGFGFLGRHGGFGCETPPSPGTDLYPEATALQPAPAVHSLLCFLLPPFPPPRFFNLSQGSCKTNRDSAKRPRQHLFFPASPQIQLSFTVGSCPLGKGKDFSTAAAPSHHGARTAQSKPARAFIPNSVYFKNKVISFSTSPWGLQGGGERQIRALRGGYSTRGAPRALPEAEAGVGPLHKHLWTDQTLWSRPSPTPSVCGRGKAELGTHGAGTAKESRENRAGGSRSQPFLCSRGVSPLSRGEMSHGEAEIPPRERRQLRRLGAKRPSLNTGKQGGRPEAAREGSAPGALTSWGSWRGWRCRRRCSCCAPGGRSPCCPTPCPSYGEKRQSLSRRQTPTR